MTQPISPQPVPSPESEPVLDEEAAGVDEAVVDEAGVEAPLNRAARRAKAKAGSPSHVGPQAGRSDQGKGPRSHTKRQIS